MDDSIRPDPALQGPVILDRSRHSISRRDIDPDALKVLYRLSGHGFIAYLVGGAVRDLLLGRHPVDFDISTDAHPNQIKKLFRNAFLIGRRFRLAHIHFQGGKVIEVATFRRKPDEEELEAERAEREEADKAAEATPEQKPIPIPGRPPLKPIAFGTPQEDAFRRDITINALFYDISTYSVIDYVGGIEDLRLGRVRVIGEPGERFTEDPVRIWRVIRHASRVDFTIEERTEQAIPAHLPLLAKASGARLFEELNKDLKSGAARPFFKLARRHSLLPIILGQFGEFYQRSDEAFGRLTESLAAVDAAIARGGSPSADIVYSLLIWPWARTVLAGAEGDKPKALYAAFRETKPAATIPKGILLDAVHTLALVEIMLEALSTGRMRWGLRKRAHYPGASKICSFLVQGAFGGGEDPFARIFNARFAAGREPEAAPEEAMDDSRHPEPDQAPGGPAHRRRRRRRPRRRRPAPQGPAT
jgi:poly(A) polymerase